MTNPADRQLGRRALFLPAIGAAVEMRTPRAYWISAKGLSDEQVQGGGRTR